MYELCGNSNRYPLKAGIENFKQGALLCYMFVQVTNAMKKLFLLHLLLFYSSVLFCQYHVRFEVTQPEPQQDKIFVAGSFNTWNPGDTNYQLSPLPLDAEHSYISIKLPAGRYEYKFTRGDWGTVETQEAGLDIANRVIEVARDTTVKVSILGWLDVFKDIPKLADTTQWQVAYSRSFFYLDRNLDSSYKYAQQANAMLLKLDDEKYDAAMARILGRIMQSQGNYQKALEYFLEQLSLVQELKDTLSIAFCLLDIGNLYLETKDYAKAKNYYLQVIKFDPDKSSAFGRSAPNLALVRMGRIYYNLHQLDSARFYTTQAYQLALKPIDRQSQSEALTLLGNIVADEGQKEKAINYYLLAIEQGKLYNSSSVIAENYLHIADVFYRRQQADSGIYYARKAFDLAGQLGSTYFIADASNLLVKLFKGTGHTDSALKYLETVVTAKDSLYIQNKNQQLQTIEFNEQLQKQESHAKQQKFISQVRTYILTAGLALLVLICIFLLVNIRRKQQVNKLLNQRSEKIQRTLAELETTQSQLIQKEKMASLGELTAGIAHEIQNPLNFINNFSEVSMEIAKELKEEISVLDIDTNEKNNLKSIADDLVQNQEKIMDHGQRADAIVKGMLQHSRNAPGEREPININILADEFLRLSYYGIRAKDKNFNAVFKTEFDENIGKINVVPQNIGRVLLNLFNNAFYSVAEKKKKLKGSFEPTVWVTTRKKDDKIEICVKDNGLGIPQDIINKIFQPFYTTKPSGHGTGLGLSLSYDIIVKEHGGTVNVESKEGEYAQFILGLPTQSA
jgi:signal transduction histidine kinase